MTTLKLGMSGDDVAWLQNALNELLKLNPKLPLNKQFGPLTEQAVKQYQKSRGLPNDGIVGKDSWTKLLADTPKLSPLPQDEPVDSEGWRNWSFPLEFIPKLKWTESPRKFGAARDHGRLHAGCDLYAPKGTSVHAVADGKLVFNPVAFYNDTWEVTIQHGIYVVRYGEIDKASCPFHKGERVCKGEIIARVGELIHTNPANKKSVGKPMTMMDSAGNTAKGIQSNMIHFELYGGTESGALTDKKSPKKYQRRADLMDPTDALNAALMHLPVTSDSSKGGTVKSGKTA